MIDKLVIGTGVALAAMMAVLAVTSWLMWRHYVWKPRRAANQAAIGAANRVEPARAAEAVELPQHPEAYGLPGGQP